jgi:hypothetical protein
MATSVVVPRVDRGHWNGGIHESSIEPGDEIASARASGRPRYDARKTQTVPSMTMIITRKSDCLCQLMVRSSTNAMTRLGGRGDAQKPRTLVYQDLTALARCPMDKVSVEVGSTAQQPHTGETGYRRCQRDNCSRLGSEAFQVLLM